MQVIVDWNCPTSSLATIDNSAGLNDGCLQRQTYVRTYVAISTLVCGSNICFIITIKMDLRLVFANPFANIEFSTVYHYNA